VHQLAPRFWIGDVSFVDETGLAVVRAMKPASIERRYVECISMGSFGNENGRSHKLVMTFKLIWQVV